MVRRPVQSEFAADVYVFPGGKVDPPDRDPELAALFDAPLPGYVPDGPEFRAAAIRELFEETGVLLMTEVDTLAASRHEAFRTPLRAGEVDLKSIAMELGEQIRVSALHPIAHWITPETMPRRYNTWFYLARLTAAQSPRHDEIETVDSVWVSPGEALDRARRGTFPLVFVTEKLLERMLAHESIDHLLESISVEDLQPVMPRVVDCADGPLFLLPGDPGY